MTTWATLPRAEALDHTRARLYREDRPHIKPERYEVSHVEKLIKNAVFTKVTALKVESGMEHESMDAWTQLAWSWMGQPQGSWAAQD
jgi:hypothetical protein